MGFNRFFLTGFLLLGFSAIEANTIRLSCVNQLDQTKGNFILQFEVDSLRGLTNIRSPYVSFGCVGSPGSIQMNVNASGVHILSFKANRIVNTEVEVFYRPFTQFIDAVMKHDQYTYPAKCQRIIE